MTEIHVFNEKELVKMCEWFEPYFEDVKTSGNYSQKVSDLISAIQCFNDGDDYYGGYRYTFIGFGPVSATEGQLYLYTSVSLK